ncbi:unnamed protein product [Peronospora belbahrii]|uniref:Uncharacterized protein n=1 Tax=Peronospora belbahrii TaxID=622444 RepID=A0AAU9KKW1_9STRA|nr:unnamed protein product [Peronospora belbahrii]CAH0521793.1 unnamed protein product [Peronospora belbahrii]
MIKDTASMKAEELGLETIERELFHQPQFDNLRSFVVEIYGRNSDMALIKALDETLGYIFVAKQIAAAIIDNPANKLMLEWRRKQFKIWAIAKIIPNDIKVELETQPGDLLLENVWLEYEKFHRDFKVTDPNYSSP